MVPVKPHNAFSRPLVDNGREPIFAMMRAQTTGFVIAGLQNARTSTLLKAAKWFSTVTPRTRRTISFTLNFLTKRRSHRCVNTNFYACPDINVAFQQRNSEGEQFDLTCFSHQVRPSLVFASDKSLVLGKGRNKTPVRLH